MRIISGEYGGRRLKALEGDNTRPTTDKVKESMFNMIGPYFDGGICLDLFAGSGGLSIEAASRGIERAILIEKHPKAIQVIHHNIAITKAPEKFQVLRSTANQYIDNFAEDFQFDLVFFDPPYRLQEIEKQIAKLEAKSMLSEDCEIVCETDAKIVLSDVGAYTIRKRQVYGTIAVTIYTK
ncbi:MAG: 16S rRNA (guanine(966)-N(2))-methyltransferase RsmD [Streptococcaceae bacterium]|nr:16S rRNA (guanine(966)-N(2))-methyltransferase RsmD [Streptococcaceae bacterium]MCH4177234.1 16S rRNA (guanine(966)-N(2))-methyltransferase RsmD [Streptococcaceae bacterium]